jgi:potassium efflux system protein
MRTLKVLATGVCGAAVWPGYLVLAAYAARQASWPRSVALPVSSLLAALALAVFAMGLIRWLLGPGGWATAGLAMPPEVARQLRAATGVLAVASVVLLWPCWVLTRGLLAPDGRPASAPDIVRVLVLGYEAVVLILTVRLLRRRSSLVAWLTESPERLGRLASHQRLISSGAIAGVAGVIALDVRGYSFSARRLATGAVGSLAVLAVCWGLYRVLLRAIDRRAWRWVKVGSVAGGGEDAGPSALPDDLAGRLRRLSGYLSAAIGLFLAARVWDLDLALFRFISEMPVWSLGVDHAGKELAVTVGDLFVAGLAASLTAVAWRHMSTGFALFVFPRMPDDPGVRFAVVTLCRYAVLGVGLLCGLSAVHMGVERIGMVLAALGVGLGFGLQEIVSNFVCGIILLLERPIRVGDVVTVAGTTGKVDRINIRATSIINGDNQSMIVPNRAFITGDLINWTLKDKVIRVCLRVKAAFGTDPDRVSEILLAIARDDPDVLANPLPSALMEELADSGQVFALSVHVPDPSLAGRVRHRLFREVQRRFNEAGVTIPLPTQRVVVKPADRESSPTIPEAADRHRVDLPATAPPSPRAFTRPTPEPLQDCHLGVDE